MKLPQLQNLIKRDPSAYREEYLQQKRAYEAEARLFTLRPSRDSPRFLELVTFMSHVAACYAKEEDKDGRAEEGVSVAVSLPMQLMALLEESAVVMLPATRKTLVQALILLRNRGLLEVREGGRE
jgi:protein SDA1